MYIPSEQDPLTPICKNCSHEDLKHKSGKCKAGVFSKCNCKQFIFDRETFQNELDELLQEMTMKLEEHKQWAIDLEKKQSGNNES